MFAILWRQDGSDGIAWYLRGIREDGTFYGEVRLQTPDEHRRLGVQVSGQFSGADCQRLAQLVGVIRSFPVRAPSRRHFGILIERLDPGDFSNIGLRFPYDPGDEITSEAARAFVEIISLLEPHLSPFLARFTHSDKLRDTCA